MVPPAVEKVVVECPTCHQWFNSGRQLSNHVAKCISFSSGAVADEGTTFGRCNTTPRMEEDGSVSSEAVRDEMMHDNQSTSEHNNSHIDDTESIRSDESLPDPVAVEVNGIAVNTQAGLTRDDVVHLQLLNLCNQMNLPLYAYDSILKWSQEAFRSGYAFPWSAPSRENVLKELYEGYNMSECRPILHDIELSGGRVAQVATFSFEEMFHSLVSDPDVWNANNLLIPVDGNSPIILPNESDILGKIVSGDWYTAAFNALCTVNDFLCPVVLFIDKMHVDEFSRWTLEPVLFTLAVFNRSTCNLSSAWRPLGLVTDINRRSTAQNMQVQKV